MSQPRHALETKSPPPATRQSSCTSTKSADLHGMDLLKSELLKLAEVNQQIMKAFQPRSELSDSKSKDFGSSGSVLLPTSTDELTKVKRTSEFLKKENDILRIRIAEYESKAKIDTPEAWQDQQREFELVLDEKTETIRTLNMQIQQLRDELRGGPTGPSREELESRKEELDAIEERLRGDEDALGRQAREMEMAMAKDRAELARQRAELQRLHEDIQREVELASRDPALRERLASLQRRPDGRPKSTITLSSFTLPALAQSGSRPATMAAIDLESDEDIKNKPSLLRRIFGG